MSKVYSFCNNCGKTGHMFQNCKQPITSVGIVAFRCNKEREMEFLMIQRKDSLGYVDFLRGKYPLYNKSYLQNIINGMTLEEKRKILSEDFNTLWNDLWGNNIGIQYRGEEKQSREKFDSLKKGYDNGQSVYSIESLIKESTTNWEIPEWGWPKGRRNYNEKDLNCATREWEEESGYLKQDIKIINNLNPIEEIFTGSNFKSYKHKYFLAYMDEVRIPVNSFQKSEVSAVSWLKYEDAQRFIRPYNIEKKEVLCKIKEILNKYTLYV